MKKRITDTKFRYEFFTNPDSPTIKEGRTYYWFKAGAIHNSEFGASGEALDGLFEKYYLSNQLAEKGVFKNGLKDGQWKSWHIGGKLSEIIQYKNGIWNGSYYGYDKDGVLVEKGGFKHGEKHGKWVNYTNKETSYYKNGAVYTKKSWVKNALKKKTPEEKQHLKQEKENLKAQKKIESDTKKQKREEKKAQRKLKSDSKKQKRIERKQAKSNADSSEGAIQNEKPERNIFQRLFSKKPKQ